MADAVKSDLDVLYPEPDEVTIRGGEKIAVREFMFGQWPRAIKLIRPVFDAVNKAGIAGFDGADMSIAPDWAARLPQVMDEGGEPLLQFVAFAIGKPREWFDSLGGDDGIAITKAVIEANASFFVRKVAPMLGMKPAAAPPTPEAMAGEALSADSSATGTAPKTSPA